MAKEAPRGRIRRYARFTRRGTWTNHTGNQHVEPLRIERPTTLAEVRELVRQAEEAGVRIRAVGSGHSWSDVALTTGYLIETHGLNRELEVDCLRDGVDSSLLVRTEAGVRLQELNRRLELDDPPLALSNMGGWDAQTVAGVMSTSTHGSGIGHGPICDQAVSVDLIGSGGQMYRIEHPDNAVTDPSNFEAAYPGWILKQDAGWFNSVLVGMGCLGILYAVTLRVEPFYYLTEKRETMPWPEVRDALRSRQILEENDHIEIYVNPHAVGSEHLCLITRRNKATGPAEGFGARHRNWSVELLGRLQPLAPNLIDWIVSHWPSVTPRFLDFALRSLRDEEYTDKWYRVLNLGTANLMPAYSMEIGVKVDDQGTHIAAMEEVFKVAAQHQKLGQVYSTSPISLRFVKASPAYMSMMHDEEGRPTMMMELIQMTRTEGGFELLAAYEEALYKVGGRPHWGQYNTLTGSHELMQSMYPRYDDWMKVRTVLNSSAVFDGPFSKRVGISTNTFVDPDTGTGRHG